MIEILLRLTVGRKADGGIRVVIDDEQPGALVGLLRSILGRDDPLPDELVDVTLTEKGVEATNPPVAEPAPEPPKPWWPPELKCGGCGAAIPLEKEPDCYAILCPTCGQAVVCPPNKGACGVDRAKPGEQSVQAEQTVQVAPDGQIVVTGDKE